MTFTGLIPAAYTPFDDRGRLAGDVIPLLAAHYRRHEIGTVFVAGTTGESLSLSVAERRQLTEHWIEAAGDDLAVIVHVGCNCLPDAVELAGHAAASGAAAVSAMAPCYFKPGTIDDLLAFLAPIASASGAVPFYFYDIPELTGVRFATDELLQRGRDRIPTLRGVKFTRDEPDLLARCLALDGGSFDVLFGQDEKLLDGLRLGARGAIGSTYNYAAPIYRRVIAAFEAGDLDGAGTHQAAAVALVDVLLEFGVLPAGKAIMSMLGIPCGAPRPPVPVLGGDDVARLRARLEPFGIRP